MPSPLTTTAACRSCEWEAPAGDWAAADRAAERHLSPGHPVERIAAGAEQRPDAIHVSPPCQKFTQMSARWRGNGGKTDQHTDLLTPTLAILRGVSIPWVVENVVGARRMMQPTLMLHGGMFGLGVHRPRLFQSNVLILAPRAPMTRDPVGVYGTKPDGRRLWTRQNGNMTGKRSVIRAAKSVEEARELMGMPWADWHGCKEAIPPAYTEYIGRQLMEHLEAKAA